MRKLVKEKLEFQRGLEPKRSLGLGMTPEKQRDFVLEKLIAIGIAERGDVFDFRETIERNGVSKILYVLEDAVLPGNLIGGKWLSKYYLTQELLNDKAAWYIYDPWERETFLFQGDYIEAIKFISEKMIIRKEKDIIIINKTINVIKKEIENIKSIKESI